MHERLSPRLGMEIQHSVGSQAARLDKTLYVRLKPQARQA
ncbi:hypothetical protein C4K19_5982 [Pseudomonas chlororaphis subsp. aurantiaca]|jgi:hypothetical protein|nr:hypothetical protein C4K19_5982 [Pseudomonas chlororaphis subsp. aurantiaca]AZD63645.1 hypothetical protein C4K18_5717 [Pseudomonas chlororaphis subsp. aurantiaca]